MKKILLSTIAIAMVMLLSIMFFGCTSTKKETTTDTTALSKDQKGSEIKVGFSLPFVEDSPYCFPYIETFKNEAAERGWKVITTDAKGDINTQANQIESLLAEDLDILIIWPVDASGIVEVIKQAYNKTEGKVPILVANSMTEPRQLDEVTGFFGVDGYDQGRIAGDYYAKYLDKNQIEKINYCELTGTAGYAVAIERSKGFIEKINELNVAGKFNLLESQPGNWATDLAQKITENWITSYGDKLEMIYCHNDGMAIGIINALQSAGYNPGQVITNGCDGQPEVLDLIKDGWVLFTIWVSPRDEAASCVKKVEKIINGETVEYFSILETPVIDSSNVDQYIDESKDIWK